MKKYLFTVLFLFFVFLLPVKASQLEAPRVLKLYPNNLFNNEASFVNGMSPRNTETLVYIDKRYVGSAGTQKCGENWCDFIFTKKLDLDKGKHSVFFISKNKTSLILSAPSREIKFEITEPIPAPTLVKFYQDKKILAGLTVSSTSIDVYIDGTYDGSTDILNNPSGTASFAYQIKRNLNPGEHKIWVIAQDNKYNHSPESKVLTIKIDFPYPAPVLFKPSINKKTGEILLTGLVKNNSTVEIYVDNKLIKIIKWCNHPSGTANFSHKIPHLTIGTHFVYTIAISGTGKKSSISRKIHFEITSKKVPTISKTAVREVNPDLPRGPHITVKGIELNPKNKKEETEEKTDIIQKKDENNLGEQKDIIKIPEEEKDNTSGLINEKKQSQNTWNVVIFVLFLIVIIFWVFWVNRELIKEKNKK